MKINLRPFFKDVLSTNFRKFKTIMYNEWDLGKSGIASDLNDGFISFFAGDKIFQNNKL